MNFDNAISDTMNDYPELVGSVRQMHNTDEDEPCWFVTFQERNIAGKEVHIEVILRDGGIVVSILGAWHMSQTASRNVTNTFTNYLQLTPE
jgi:hypothetical protein